MLPRPAPKRRRRWLRAAVEVLALGGGVFLVVGLRMHVLEPTIIPSRSMEPTLHVGDHVLVMKNDKRSYVPRRGDIITFPDPIAPDVLLIKRVVGLPGEGIATISSQVYVNGRVLTEPYAEYRHDDNTVMIMIPPGHVYVLGDNRSDSEDSRDWGTVPIKSIRGHAVRIYYPFHRWQRLR
jgi:signal peptidase I